MSSIFDYSFVERTRMRQAVQFRLESESRHIQGQALQSHNSFKQIPIDLCVGSQNLTMTKATRNERIHNAVRSHQYKLKEVGDHLGLGYSTINVIAKRVDESNKS